MLRGAGEAPLILVAISDPAMRAKGQVRVRRGLSASPQPKRDLWREWRPG
ncbi:hypothetical protein OF850_21805 [Roseococcus sp. MDT2-1-1]|uniref:Uncharacterized protein n=1 Tax=Sabulicella glaciei TaxID=2984948 RepID=A0ABT3P1E8_9PROT|nr:hypothetical protein [Roseococcus sp. MDT2-1-1]